MKTRKKETKTHCGKYEHLGRKNNTLLEVTS